MKTHVTFIDRPHTRYWPWSKKNLYHPVKWDQDVAAIRDAYQNKGYLDIDTHAPIVEVRRKKKGKGDDDEPEVETEAEPPPEPEIPDPGRDAEVLTPKQAQKAAKKAAKQEKEARKKARKAKKKESKRWVYLTVPLTEGPSYSLGEITIEGAEVFPTQVLRAQIPMADGGVFNNSALTAGVRESLSTPS